MINENIDLEMHSDAVKQLDNVDLGDVAAATYTLPYLQDFESNIFLPVDWEAFGSNANAAWELANFAGGFGQSLNSAHFDNFNNNVLGNFYGMRSVLLDLTNAVEPKLKFDVAYARRNANTSDRLGIWYSFNGTTNWNNLVNYDHANLTTAPDQNIFFIPASEEWDSITIDLTQFAGTSLIRFAFENNSQNGNALYVDNVHFYDDHSTDIECVCIDPGNLTIYPNPTMGKFTLELGDKNAYHNLSIQDMTGKTVAFIQLDVEYRTQIDISYLQKGIYILNAVGSKYSKSEKFIIN